MQLQIVVIHHLIVPILTSQIMGLSLRAELNSKLQSFDEENSNTSGKKQTQIPNSAATDSNREVVSICFNTGPT
jgi:hypothetical protein